MSYYDYYPRSSKPSHSGGDSHNGSFEPGRTVLPPLTVAFPTSDSPVSGGSHSSPHPPQQHPTYVQQQQYHPSTQQHAQAAYGQTSYPSSSFQLPPSHDPRHQSGQAYNYRGSPSSHSSDPRRLPPLSVPSVPQQDRWPSGQYHYPADLQMQPPPTEMRSPQQHVYSPQAAAGYPQYQSLTHTHTHTSPYVSGSSRGSMPVAAPANPHHHHQSMPMGPSSVDRTQHMPRTSAQLPYARSAAELASPVDYPSDPSEPTIKKKRKRADARQLEVLNATYNRTAFPSTEERAALAKQLDMSARSVQIWFQNKRQAMRQGGRATNPATTPVSSAGSAPPPVPTPTPPVGYRGPSPAVTSRMMQQQQQGIAYSSRSPPPPPPQPVRGQTPSPPSGRSRDDPRRNWPQARGY